MWFMAMGGLLVVLGVHFLSSQAQGASLRRFVAINGPLEFTVSRSPRLEGFSASTRLYAETGVKEFKGRVNNQVSVCCPSGSSMLADASGWRFSSVVSGMKAGNIAVG